MGATLSVIKTILFPACIAAAAYLLLTFVIVPLWQRYRNRCSHYLPLDSISSQTTSLRQRMQSSVGRFLIPSNWNLRRIQPRAIDAGGGGTTPLHFGLSFGRHATEIDDDAGLLSDDEDDRLSFVIGEAGEELGAMPNGQGRTQVAGAQAYNTSRLSRDLEQGFMDDSDEEDAPAR